MTNPESPSVCKFCTEPVKVNARVCPHCRQWLTLRALRNPQVLGCVVGGLLSLTLIPMYFILMSKFANAFNPRPFYYESSRGLRLTQSTMLWQQFDSSLRIVITGVVSNESEIPWKDVEFECRFFDTNGTMVDVANQARYLSVQPHDETAFAMRVMPARNTNSYASYRLMIVTAQNGQNRD